MTRVWYYRSGDTTYGPVSGAELKRLTRTGEVQPDDLVRKVTASNWIRAIKVKGLFPTPPPIPEAWYYARNGAKHGPVGTANLKAIAQAGQLQPSDHVWREGMADWQPASAVKALFPLEKPTSPTPLPTRPTPKQAEALATVEGQPDVWADLTPVGVDASAPVLPRPGAEFAFDDDISDAVRPVRPRPESAAAWAWARRSALLTILGVVLPALLAIPGVLVREGCSGGGSSGKSSTKSEAAVRMLTIREADEEFRIAASQKGERALTAAKMLIGFRNQDNWTWERLNGEVDFQFNAIEDEFSQWKRRRIAAGDRYK